MSNKPRKMTLEKKHNLTGWAFLAPATFLIAVFSFWPMIKALVLSFQTGKGRNMQMAVRFATTIGIVMLLDCVMITFGHI